MQALPLMDGQRGATDIAFARRYVAVQAAELVRKPGAFQTLAIADDIPSYCGRTLSGRT